MTILHYAQDGHSDVDLDDKSSSKDCLVEMGGVEPPSESTLTEISPGADGYFGDPCRLFPLPKASRHALGSGSFIIHGALKALRTHGRC